MPSSPICRGLKAFAFRPALSLIVHPSRENRVHLKDQHMKTRWLLTWLPPVYS